MGKQSVDSPTNSSSESDTDLRGTQTKELLRSDPKAIILQQDAWMQSTDESNFIIEGFKITIPQDKRDEFSFVAKHDILGRTKPVIKVLWLIIGQLRLSMNKLLLGGRILIIPSPEQNKWKNMAREATTSLTVRPSNSENEDTNFDTILDRSKLTNKRSIEELWELSDPTIAAVVAKHATSPTPMSCVVWNSRGLGNQWAFLELKLFIAEKDPSLIFISESKLRDYQIDW